MIVDGPAASLPKINVWASVSVIVQHGNSAAGKLKHSRQAISDRLTPVEVSESQSNILGIVAKAHWCYGEVLAFDRFVRGLAK